MSHAEHDSQAEQNIKRDVKEYGWSVCLFEEDSATPAFAYTIGLWKNFKHSEVISFGLSLDTLHAILNDVGEWARNGKTVELGVNNYEVLERLPVQFRQVDHGNIPDYFGYGRWFYEYQDFPVIQLIWPDRDSNYPWDNGYDARYKFSQPLLEHKLDFKFFEPRDTAAFVARQIFTENRPILRVHHSEDDGAWQFLTGETVTADDIIVVALEEVIKRDPSINSLFNLPTGRLATRESIGGKWTREKIEEEEE